MQDEFVFGIHAVGEALRGSRRAFELFVSGPAGNDRRLTKILELASAKGVHVRQRQKQDLSRLCSSDHHQGVVLRVEPFPYAEIEELVESWGKIEGDALVLVLDSIQDPANLGSLVRSAACAGVLGVIIVKDRAASVTPAVERVSAGAVETVPIACVTNLVHALKLLKDAGYWVYGLAQESSSSIYSLNLKGKTVLVVGNEGDGIRPLVAKSCDQLASIPMQGGIGTLNAAVAGGIALFEAVRQQHSKGEN